MVFFNRAYEEGRFVEWIQKQEDTRIKANAVCKDYFYILIYLENCYYIKLILYDIYIKYD